MSATVVRPRDKFRPARLVEPPPSGYIHLAAAVEPPPGRAGRPGSSPAKAALLERLTAQAAELQRGEDVLGAAVYRAAVVGPPAGWTPPSAVHTARYDVAVLVETRRPQDIGAVQETAPYRHMRQALGEASADVHVMTAHCGKCLGDVDRGRQGLFLFNYFVGEDPEVSLDLWDYLAGWYTRETGLDNSVLLEPLAGTGSDYAFVNHARWDTGLAGFALRQFTKPSFYRFVQPNLKRNRTMSMPLFHRLVERNT
jgi:hypothetical protein